MKALGPIICGTAFCLTSAVSGPCPFTKSTGEIRSGSIAGEPEMYQIIITEIMADPNPPEGLPDAEYIEIYNSGESVVTLTGCRLILGSIEKVLPPADLESMAYMILCDAKEEMLFKSQGKTLPIEKMPAVVNTGQVIALKSRSGHIISSVDFTDRWYRSEIKSGGGWSLERIDVENICGNGENWTESTDPHGGTPGCRNSVSAACPDRQMPMLLRATLGPDSLVLIHFNESMDSTTLCNPSAFSANHGLLQPIGADPVEPAYTSVALNFGSRLEPDITYTVTSLNNLKDCAGNLLNPNAYANFGLPGLSDSLDVIINELLFDTPSSLSEFIELYNRSQKTVDLAEYSIALCDQYSDSIIRQTSLKSNSFLLFPDHYVVVTRRADQLPNSRNRLDLSHVVELPRLFVLPDAGGEIALLANSGKVIDRFRYAPGMHSAFLLRTEGIALERILPDGATNDPGNWYSAASPEGYATPGYKNSQSLSSIGGNANISIHPAVFSPDNDGFDDEVVLAIEPGGSGYMANIRIFDTGGRLIRTMASQVLLATETTLTWDGTCNDQSQADIGIYLIYIELINQEGLIKKCRKVVTLARRL